MSLNSISTIGLRLYLGFALCVFSTLAMALCASYSLGGPAPAAMLYAFLCTGCGAGRPLLALAGGAALAAMLLRPANGTPERERSPAARPIGTVKPQC